VNTLIQIQFFNVLIDISAVGLKRIWDLTTSINLLHIHLSDNDFIPTNSHIPPIAALRLDSMKYPKKVRISKLIDSPKNAKHIHCLERDVTLLEPYLLACCNPYEDIECCHYTSTDTVRNTCRHNDLPLYLFVSYLVDMCKTNMLTEQEQGPADNMLLNVMNDSSGEDDLRSNK
jgi:hypothetical protein